MPKATIFQAAGGEQAFQELATVFHRLCLADPVLEHPFSHGGHPDHVQRLGWYWAEVLGGPPRWTEAGGGQSPMIKVHANQGADPELGERFAFAFARAQDEAGFPADPELRAALGAYMEWAVEDVLAYSPADAQVPRDLPMPRWGWDGLAA